ncbi:hypothetical protein OUZ56_005856 [Daphnia magna]|uniref:GMP synthase n=1 Tax=Daphnia magna TaxID=35525 RepID=A0ABQ9YTZ0_9CRUS|nr:hypothetical protein OUZ56_005856 [Daphnia magna]
MVHYANIAAKEHALLNRIEIVTSEEERLLLGELSSRNQYVATLLPIRTVGVQIRNLDVVVIMPRSSFNGQWVLVIMANGLSRIPTTMAPVALRLAQRSSYFLVEEYGTRRGRCVSQFGSSYESYVLPSRYPRMRNPYDMMYNNAMSP